MRSFLTILITLVSTLNLVTWVSSDRLLAHAGAGPGWRAALAAFILIQFAGVVSLFVSRGIFRREPGKGADRPLHILTMLWNPLLSLPAAVITTAALGLFAFAGGHEAEHRAAVIALVFLLPAIALLAALVAHRQLGRFVVRRRTLVVPGLPQDLRGLKIAHVSDLHVGALTRGEVLRKITRETNALDADLVVLTGDIINMSLAALPEAMATLGGMTARLGVFGVEGNHDLMEDAALFESRIKASGLNFLMNERAVVSVNGRNVVVIGLRWGEGHGHARTASDVRSAVELTRLLDRGEPGDFNIVLAHHPDAFDATAAARVPLTFAGHTHGGQLMLTKTFGFGPWFYRYWSGDYSSGDSRLVVSNGTGNWFPLRLGAPAEITLITLA